MPATHQSFLLLIDWYGLYFHGLSYYARWIKLREESSQLGSFHGRKYFHSSKIYADQKPIIILLVNIFTSSNLCPLPIKILSFFLHKTISKIHPISFCINTIYKQARNEITICCKNSLDIIPFTWKNLLYFHAIDGQHRKKGKKRKTFSIKSTNLCNTVVDYTGLLQSRRFYLVVVVRFLPFFGETGKICRSIVSPIQLRINSKTIASVMF